MAPRALVGLVDVGVPNMPGLTCGALCSKLGELPSRLFVVRILFCLGGAIAGENAESKWFLTVRHEVMHPMTFFHG
jgi:hypothetical protein